MRRRFSSPPFIVIDKSAVTVASPIPKISTDGTTEPLREFLITKSISDIRSTVKQRLLLTRTSESLSVPKANGLDSRTRMKPLLIRLLGISFERYAQANAEEQVWVISINITDSCSVRIAVPNYTSSEELPSSEKTTASSAAVTVSIWVKSNVRLTA